MSDFRTGALSSFPGSVDQFVIKRPFGDGDPNSQELADHFNHYFDAAVKLEEWALENLGGPITGRNPDGYDTSQLTNTNCMFSYQTVTIPLTGDITEWNMVVPAVFGSDPFNDVRYSIGLTASLTPFDLDRVKGVGANTDWGTTGPLNTLLQFPQIFAMAYPVGGRNYKIAIHAKAFADGFSPIFSDQTFSDTFVRTSPTINQPVLGPYQNLGPSWTLSNTTKQFAIIQTDTAAAGTLPCLVLVTEADVKEYGVASPANFGSCGDQQVQFQLHDLLGDGAGSGSRTSVGFVLRSNLVEDNLNGYGLLIGNAPYPSNGWATAQIVKFVGYDTTQTLDGSFDPVGADATCLSLLGDEYQLHLNDAGTPTNYRFKVVGNTITLEENVSGSVYTVVLSTTDGSSSYSRGRPGAFAIARDGIRIRASYFTGVSFKGLDPLDSMTVDIRILHAKVGAQGIGLTLADGYTSTASGGGGGGGGGGPTNTINWDPNTMSVVKGWDTDFTALDPSIDVSNQIVAPENAASTGGSYVYRKYSVVVHLPAGVDITGYRYMNVTLQTTDFNDHFDPSTISCRLGTSEVPNSITPSDFDIPGDSYQFPSILQWGKILKMKTDISSIPSTSLDGVRSLYIQYHLWSNGPNNGIYIGPITMTNS